MTDLNVKEVFYPQTGMNPDSKFHVLLASFTTGKDSKKLDGMTDQDIIAECLQDLAKIHQRDLPFIKKEFRTGVVKRWAKDEHTIGAYTSFEPFQYIEILDVLKKREGKIIFAGEHTSYPHGWLNTAIRTGVRAALEVNLLACNATK